MNEILEKIKKVTKPRSAGQKEILQPEIDSIKSQNEIIDIFERELNRCGGNPAVCDSDEKLLSGISDVLKKQNAMTIVYDKNIKKEIIIELQKTFPDKKIEPLNSSSSPEEIKDKLSRTDIGVSIADYLIAETGTAVIFSNNTEGRILSILTPVNIIIAEKNNVLPDMKTLLKVISDKYGDKIPHSAIIFITGPSRTADIEKILIIGVHGPKELFVFIK